MFCLRHAETSIIQAAHAANKEVKAMKKIIIAGIICILLMIACFSPWRGGDFGTFTIITGSGNGRTIWGDSEGGNINDLIHTISLSGGPEQVEPKIVEGSQTVQFTVKPGFYKIFVMAELEDEDGARILNAVGSDTVNIKPGKNGAIPINMHEPDGEGYYKVTFEFDKKTINRYIPEGDKVTIPEYYYRKCEKSIDAGLYNELFYDDKLIVNDKNVKWTNNGEPFIFDNGSHEAITDSIDSITLTGEWKMPERINFPPTPGADLITSVIRVTNDLYSLGNGSDYTLLLENDISISNPEPDNIFFKNPINLVLIGKETTRTIRNSAEKGPIFVLQSNVNLKLGKNITLIGNNDNYSPLVIVENATLTMLDGSKITGNTNIYKSTSNYGQGGAVRVEGSEENQIGYFIMEGGEINGNTAVNYFNDEESIEAYQPGNGGGVYVYMYGTFTMRGGKINDNTTVYWDNVNHQFVSGNGGGVYVAGKFEIPADSPNAIISGNSADYGGGVYVASGGTFTMRDGTIGGGPSDTNIAPQGGGGIYVCGVPPGGGGGPAGEFKKIGGGTIIGNKAEKTSDGITKIEGHSVNDQSLSIASNDPLYPSDPWPPK